METTATLTIPVNATLKAKADEVLKILGLSQAAAISMYLRSIVSYGHIPADVECANFNEETLAAMEESRGIENGTVPSKAYKTAEEMMEDILDA